MFYTKKQRISDMRDLFWLTKELASAKQQFKDEDIQRLTAIVNTLEREIINA